MKFSSRAFYWIVLTMVLILSACNTGAAPNESGLEPAALPNINLSSPYLLPVSGNDAVTCKGIAGKTAIRTLRLSGGIRSDAQLTLDYLSVRTSINADVPFSSSKDANFYSGIGGQSVGLTKDGNGQNVAVLPFGNVWRFAGPLQNLSNDVLTAQTTMRTELVTPGKRITGLFDRQLYLPAFSPDFNRMFPPLFGPIGLGDGKEFATLSFAVVLEESKGYAAGKGYLFSNVLLNPPGSTYIFPNGPYFTTNGIGILSGSSVYGTFDCNVHKLPTTTTTPTTPPKKGK